MLHFTAAGAVASPEVLQIRATQAYPGRIIAGAKTPTRGLSAGEIAANIRHFTLDRRGPRSFPVHSLVLAGMDLQADPEIPKVVRDGRSWGLEQVTLHLGRGERDAVLASSLLDVIDAIVLVVADPRDVADVGAFTGARRVHAVVILDEATLARLDGLVEALAMVRPNLVVFSWPFPAKPGSPAPPHAHLIATVLTDAVRVLEDAGVAVGIKGLPACAVGSLQGRIWKSRNRWYVDADHQKSEALLFFPEVVRFLAVDECRFCDANPRCDGLLEPWYRAGLVGRVRAISSREAVPTSTVSSSADRDPMR